MINIKKILDESEETWVDDVQLRKDTGSERKRLANIINGNKPPSHSGKVRTDEWKNAHRIPCSDEKKEKIGKSNAGKVRSEELKKQWSATKRAKQSSSWNKGLTMDEATRAKISETKLLNPNKEEIGRKIAIANTKFVYHSSKGTFYVLKDLINAFPEFSPERIPKWCAGSKNGFSRTPK